MLVYEIRSPVGDRFHQSYIDWSWWGFIWHANHDDVGALRDVTGQVASGATSCGIIATTTIPIDPLDKARARIICGLTAWAFKDMSSEAARVYDDGNCMNLYWSWSTVWWDSEVKPGAANFCPNNSGGTGAGGGGGNPPTTPPFMNTEGSPGYATLYYAPTLSSITNKALPDNAHINIVCQTQGDSVSGPLSTETLWDKLDIGSYIPDALVFTGSNSQTFPTCTGGGPPAPVWP